MATSKNSPTAGDTAVTTTNTGDVPQEPHPETQLDQSMAAKGAKPAAEQDVSGDFEKQNPEPVEETEDQDDEEDELTPQERLDKEMQEEANGGETWARYVASGNHMRGLTVRDQREIGVPEDAVVDNTDTATPRTLKGGLESGLWFTLQNRFRTNVSEVHPILLEFLQEDPDFEVKTY